MKLIRQLQTFLMGCFVVARFLLTSASRGPSASAKLLVTQCQQTAGVIECWDCIHFTQSCSGARNTAAVWSR